MARSLSKSKNIKKYLFLLLLLVGVVIGTYLVQHAQIFNQHASSGSGPYGSTPISEVDIYPKPANHIQTFTFLNLSSDQVENQYFDYITKELDLYMAGAAPYVPTDPRYLQLGPKFKARNPNMKFAIYTQLPIVEPNLLPFNQLVESDFLHRPDGSRISLTLGPNHNIINLADSAVLIRVIDIFKNMFATYQVDGMLLDSYYAPGFYPSVTGGSCAEGPCNDDNWWFSAVTNYSTALMQNLPGAIIFHGGGGKTEYNQWINGIFDEGAGEILGSSDTFTNHIAKTWQTVAEGKSILFNAQPGYHCPNLSGCDHPTSDDGYVFSNDLNLERFYLASYMLIQDPHRTYFGYNPGNVNNPGDLGLLFYSDWNMNYGIPLETYNSTMNPGIFFRSYEHGYAVVNPTTSPQTFRLAAETYKLWDPCDGQVVVSDGAVTVPAKTGWFMFFGNIPCDKITSLPAPTATPMVVPTIPQTSAAPGAFTLNQPEAFCSGTNSYIRMSWTAAPNGPREGVNSGYFVYIDGQYKYNVVTSLSLDDPEPKNYGQSYTYKIQAYMPGIGESFSNERTVTAANCSAPTTAPIPSVAPTASLTRVPKPTPGTDSGSGSESDTGEPPISGKPPKMSNGSYNRSLPAGKSADFNNDGSVNFSDYSVFISLWRKNDMRADLNNDGKVTGGDISLMLFQTPKKSK